MAERYLRAVAGQDWATVERVPGPDGRCATGPSATTSRGSSDYMGFLRRTMPSLPGYRIDIDRVTELGGGRVLVELRETVEIDGRAGASPTSASCSPWRRRPVARVSIYLRQARARPAGRAVGFAP